jgi:hypothetical protein
MWKTVGFHIKHSITHLPNLWDQLLYCRDVGVLSVGTIDRLCTPFQSHVTSALEYGYNSLMPPTLP